MTGFLRKVLFPCSALLSLSCHSFAYVSSDSGLRFRRRGAEAWTRIFFDDFEYGMGNFQDGGNDAQHYCGTYAKGSCSVEIRDDSDSASSFYTGNIASSVSLYTSLKVKFSFYSLNLNRGEDFFLEYNDGSDNWVEARRWARNTNFVNKQWYDEEVEMAVDPANLVWFQIRFRCDASTNNDQLYIDNVELLGLSSGLLPTSPPSPQPSFSPSDSRSLMPSDRPTISSSNKPSHGPTDYTSNVPSNSQTATEIPAAPTSVATPTSVPTGSPFDPSSTAPSNLPSVTLSDVPSKSTSDYPSNTPSVAKSASPSHRPSNVPSISQSDVPSHRISEAPMKTAPSWTRIFFDDFEYGMGNFQDGGSDAKHYCGTYAKDSCSVEIRDDSDVSSSIYTGNIASSVSSYTSLKVKFSFYSLNLNRGEDFFLEYTNGSDWVEAQRLVRTTNFVNNQWYDEEVEMAVDPSDLAWFQIRFRCDASTNKDQLYIDNVELLGHSSGPAPPSPSPPPPPPPPPPSPVTGPLMVCSNDGARVCIDASLDCSGPADCVPVDSSCLADIPQHDPDNVFNHDKITIDEFVVFGDTPYFERDRYCLNSILRSIDLNCNADRLFLAHVGDVKKGGDANQYPCCENGYKAIANMLVHEDNALCYNPDQIFFLVGDNEWNECGGLNQGDTDAWSYWIDHLGGHSTTSGFGTLSSKSNLAVERQSEITPGVARLDGFAREENFRFYKDEVLYIGLNMVGTDTVATDELFFQQNLDWVTSSFQEYAPKAAVIMGHASLGGFRSAFGNPFKQLLREYYGNVPVIYIYGDGHNFCTKYPDSGNRNLVTVQVDDSQRGGSNPVIVTVRKNVDTGELFFQLNQQGGEFNGACTEIEQDTWGVQWCY